MRGLQKAQGEVNEVTEIMLGNYNKAKEREEKLSDLENRAEELHRQGKVFEKTTRILMEQKKEECEFSKKPKRKCVLGAIGAVVAIIIGLVVFVVLKFVI